MGNYRADGTPLFRKKCQMHHSINYGIDGWEYKIHRKNYCENKDGRLGFKCKYKIQIEAQLQVDHINGNPTDHREENLQTLCANCHVFKTLENKDYLSPGRRYFKYTPENSKTPEEPPEKNFRIESFGNFEILLEMA
jgi:5-methylcytosine-specific restriction endonuclease McrA